MIDPRDRELVRRTLRNKRLQAIAQRLGATEIVEWEADDAFDTIAAMGDNDD